MNKKNKKKVVCAKLGRGCFFAMEKQRRKPLWKLQVQGQRTNQNLYYSIFEISNTEKSNKEALQNCTYIEQKKKLSIAFSISSPKFPSQKKDEVLQSVHFDVLP